MSAASASVRPEQAIALLPSDRVPSPAQREARERMHERVRRLFTAAYFVAMALPPAAVLIGPASGDDWPIAVMILCYGLVMPGAGLVVLVFAVSRRTPRETRVLLTAVLALVASVALLPRAGRIGTEAALDRNAGELEAITGEVVRGGPQVWNLVDGRWDRWSAGAEPAPEVLAAAERIRRRMQAAGFASVTVGEGYLMFQSRAPLAPRLLYRTGAGAVDLAESCARWRLRYAGGPWYLLECRYPEEYDN